jgi:hypothetical protein
MVEGGKEGMLKYEESHLNKFLTEKEVVGFVFEMEGQELLTSFGISFQGNPTEPVEWKCNVGHGVDIKTQLFLMEFKFCNFKVYPSHVYSHVLPRFDDGDSRAKVVVTNNKLYWYSVKYILNAKGIMLWDLKDLKNYYSIPSFVSIYNFIKRDVQGTSLVKDNSIILTTKTYKLRSVGKKILSKNVKLSPSHGSLDAFARREHRAFHYQCRGESYGL